MYQSKKKEAWSRHEGVKTACSWFSWSHACLMQNSPVWWQGIHRCALMSAAAALSEPPFCITFIHWHNIAFHFLLSLSHTHMLNSSLLIKLSGDYYHLITSICSLSISMFNQSSQIVFRMWCHTSFQLIDHRLNGFFQKSPTCGICNPFFRKGVNYRQTDTKDRLACYEFFFSSHAIKFAFPAWILGRKETRKGLMTGCDTHIGVAWQAVTWPCERRIRCGTLLILLTWPGKIVRSSFMIERQHRSSLDQRKGRWGVMLLLHSLATCFWCHAREREFTIMFLEMFWCFKHKKKILRIPGLPFNTCSTPFNPHSYCLWGMNLKWLLNLKYLIITWNITVSVYFSIPLLFFWSGDRLHVFDFCWKLTCAITRHNEYFHSK